MSNTDPLAHKIAQLIEASVSDSKLASIFAALEKINHRLDKIESAQQTSKTRVPSFQTNHSSLDKFAIAEAVADSVIASKSEEKTCSFEPDGRPCDHCSMCSARGF
jgi:hypothetical protein